MVAVSRHFQSLPTPPRREPRAAQSPDRRPRLSAAKAPTAGTTSEELITRVRRAFEWDGYFEGLFALSAGYVRSPSGRILEAMHAGVRQIVISRAVTAAAAHGLGWAPQEIVSLDRLAPRTKEDTDRVTAWLDEVLPAHVGRRDEPSEALLARARLRWLSGATLDEMTHELPTSRATAGRLGLLRAEAASASGQPPRKVMAALFRAVGRDPNLTAGWRDIGAAARRCGRLRNAARAYAEALRCSLPPQPQRYAQLRRTAAPSPIGPSGALPIVDPRAADLHKMLDQGDYYGGLSLYTNHFKSTGNVRSLSGAHAALNALDISAHVLENAADRLGWSDQDFRSLECCKKVGAVEGRRWIHWLDRALPLLAGTAQEPVDALLMCARARLSAGANAAEVAEALPRSAAGRSRADLIEAEAALVGGDARWANQLLTRVSLRAPHVTAVHRGLGQIARAQHRPLDAARHFEAAMISPNMPSHLADRAEIVPLRMTTLAGNCDVYCYLGRTFLLRRDARTLGITAVAGQLLIVRDTLGYRQWVRMTTNTQVHAVRRMAAAYLRGSEMADPFATGDPVLVRLLRRLALFVPARARGALECSFRRLHWVLVPFKQPAEKLVKRAVVLGRWLLGTLKVLALRFWMRAELVSEFLDSDRPNDIFRHAASGRADRPRR